MAHWRWCTTTIDSQGNCHLINVCSLTTNPSFLLPTTGILKTKHNLPSHRHYRYREYQPPEIVALVWEDSHEDSHKGGVVAVEPGCYRWPVGMGDSTDTAWVDIVRSDIDTSVTSRDHIRFRKHSPFWVCVPKPFMNHANTTKLYKEVYIDKTLKGVPGTRPSRVCHKAQEGWHLVEERGLGRTICSSLSLSQGKSYLF